MADILSIEDESGVTRHLGNIAPPAGLVRAWPTYGDTAETPMVPRTQWAQHCHREPPTNKLFFTPPTHDQNGYGMCNASATTAAMEARRARQGLPYVKLSAGDLYGRINGGVDRGSLLEDGLMEATAKGVASVDVVPYLDWRSDGSEAVKSRAKYRVLEAFLCPTFAHCMSAVISGFDLISGIMWYSNYTPDADGWLPSGRGQAGGHAVYGFLPMMRGSTFGIGHQNSWNVWGWKGTGFCVFPEASYSGPVGGWWAVRSVVDEGGIIPEEKP